MSGDELVRLRKQRGLNHPVGSIACDPVQRTTKTLIAFRCDGGPRYGRRVQSHGPSFCLTSRSRRSKRRREAPRFSFWLNTTVGQAAVGRSRLEIADRSAERIHRHRQPIAEDVRDSVDGSPKLLHHGGLAREKPGDASREGDRRQDPSEQQAVEPQGRSGDLRRVTGHEVLRGASPRGRSPFNSLVHTRAAPCVHSPASLTERHSHVGASVRLRVRRQPSPRCGRASRAPRLVPRPAAIFLENHAVIFHATDTAVAFAPMPTGCCRMPAPVSSRERSGHLSEGCQ